MESGGVMSYFICDCRESNCGATGLIETCNISNGILYITYLDLFGAHKEYSIVTKYVYLYVRIYDTLDELKATEL